ncbi:hypothetical protein AB0H49_22790 [Nocardia sp. NPDC050713]|uniref:hypothetical protein n=1 Tax=Nocardia sp. NPDC050713 TaxID=3154511 RepID=UPI0033EBD488
MSIPAIPIPALPAPWVVAARSHLRTTALLDVCRPTGISATVELERAAIGRLRHTYPVNAHDIEARVIGAMPEPVLSDVLAALSAAVTVADPLCRRLVYAAPAGDVGAIAAAEAVGFRHVIDVDLPDAELSLLVFEPSWVGADDIDLDHVPGT